MKYCTYLYFFFLFSLPIFSQNEDISKIANNLELKENIPNKTLSIEWQLFINTLISINYEKNIYSYEKVFNVNFEAGMGVNHWAGDIDAITQQINIRTMYGSKHCIEVGTEIYLNYFLFEKKSHSFINSDFIKFRYDISYRYQVTYEEKNKTIDTDMFKVTLGMYYMLNRPPREQGCFILNDIKAFLYYYSLV